MSSSPPPPDPSAHPQTDPGTRRRTRVLAVLTAVLVVVVAALGWLFWTEDDQPPRPPVALESLLRIDGTLTVVEPDRLVMKPFEPLNGKSEVEFALLEEYRRYFDLAHLRSHAAVGLPTRIYYVERSGQLVAVYKGDAPVNSAPSDSP